MRREAAGFRIDVVNILDLGFSSAVQHVGELTP